MKKRKTKSAEKAYNQLALERTILSNERTTLSYIRTGLTAFALGIALMKIFEDVRLGLMIGVITSVVGVSFFFVGMHYHKREKKIIEKEKKIINESN